MHIIGIIAEYNPFHGGHQAQYAAVRARFGAETPIVVALGGCFTQRGEPARYSKYARAEAALRCGADLVVELPLPWAASSAEHFARGGTAVLEGLGFVDTLACGSECADPARLERLAAVLAGEDWLPGLRRGLDGGMSFPAARQAAVEALLGEPVPELARRNDILALEYRKALQAQGSAMALCPLPRDGRFPPASHLRSLPDPLSALPEAAAAVFRRERSLGREVLPEALSLPLLCRLRTMTAADWAALPDAGEGLPNRIARAALRFGTAEQVVNACVTRRYPAARIRRLLLAALLGLPAGGERKLPAYVRILGMRPRGAALLHDHAPRLPRRTRPSEGKGDPIAELEARAVGVYTLGFSHPAQRDGGLDWRRSPVFLPNLEEAPAPDLSAF